MKFESAGSYSSLEVKTDLMQGAGVTSLMVDGVDILTMERPLNSSGRPVQFLPIAPAELLPPDSASLFPSALPHPVAVGTGWLGLVGDSSLWMAVWRDGRTVHWAPTENRGYSVGKHWAFDLVDYLDALDEGFRSTRAWETSSHRLARRLRQEATDPFGYAVGSTVHHYRLLDAQVSPTDITRVLLTVAGPNGVADYLVPVPEGAGEQSIAAELREFSPERYEQVGSSR